MAPLTPYRSVPEGLGGIYSFPPGTNSHIGTSNCKTCVGVYLAFQNGSCFCAHINSFINLNDETWDHTPTAKEGEKIKGMVVGMLNSTCGTAKGLMTGREVVVICPRMFEDTYASDPEEWENLVGWFVVEGVRSWLEKSGSDQKDFVCDERAQGFVVNHLTGEVAKIPTTASKDEVEGGVVVRGWFAIPEDEDLDGEEWEPVVFRAGRPKAASI